jgi:hypothetical protein
VLRRAGHSGGAVIRHRRGDARDERAVLVRRVGVGIVVLVQKRVECIEIAVAPKVSPTQVVRQPVLIIVGFRVVEGITRIRKNVGFKFHVSACRAADRAVVKRDAVVQHGDDDVGFAGLGRPRSRRAAQAGCGEISLIVVILVARLNRSRQVNLGI